MSGDKIKAITAVRVGTRLLVRTKAAGTPSSIAKNPVATPTSNERTVAARQISEPKYSSYHCSENPTGGHSINLPDVNDTGITKNAGATRNITTEIAQAVS